MKKIFLGIILGITLCFIMSYTSIDGANGNSTQTVYPVPIIQKNVIVTTSKDYMLKLIKRGGYVVQDVDLSYRNEFSVKYHYTIIKY